MEPAPQGSLFELGPPVPVPAKKTSRRPRIAPPAMDLPIAEGSPGYAVYDFIVRDPMLSLLVARPGEYVLAAMKTYTLIDLEYEVR